MPPFVEFHIVICHLHHLMRAMSKSALFSPLMKLESFLEVKYNDRSEGDLLWLNDIQKSSKNKCY